MRDLEASGIVCEVSAVTDAGRGALVPGQRFDRAAMMGLPDEVDRFGENGEFPHPGEGVGRVARRGNGPGAVLA